MNGSKYVFSQVCSFRLCKLLTLQSTVTKEITVSGISPAGINYSPSDLVLTPSMPILRRLITSGLERVFQKPTLQNRMSIRIVESFRSLPSISLLQRGKYACKKTIIRFHFPMLFMCLTLPSSTFASVYSAWQLFGRKKERESSYTT